MTLNEMKINIIAKICVTPISRNKSREGKILNLFTIVRFKNSACTGTTTTQSGICYPYANCLMKSGTTDGSCALGEVDYEKFYHMLVKI